MGENTKIAWCDHTFNPWWGCSKVSAGCANCYAEKLATRFGYGNMWFLPERRFFADEHWNEPIVWDRQAAKSGKIARVFCGSMCDIFDDPYGDYETALSINSERDRLWRLIMDTPHLEWLLLTKRPENIYGGMYFRWQKGDGEPSNVRIGITCENQQMADKRIPILLNAWHGKNFISVEPMLSEIKLTKWIACNCPHDYFDGDGHNIYCPESNKYIGKKIDWVICGCESGANARPCDISWVHDLRDQCVQSGTPYFLKQLVIDGKLVREPFLDGKQYLEFPK